MLQVQKALQGISYGIIGALIVQVSFNAISQKKQEQDLTKPVLLKDLSQKQIESMSQLSNTVTLVPVKSNQEQNSSLKSFIVKPIPTHENETEAKK
ncbi:MAG: hypothetical protein PHN18_10305 [Sulfurospirillaceae bacterium]|nr:hypothetical protein [Sulfurospirillaceae bacterium]MDD2827469.1 hypothetical protein [Sulfurospirillaceae bacterium]